MSLYDQSLAPGFDFNSYVKRRAIVQKIGIVILILWIIGVAYYTVNNPSKKEATVEQVQTVIVEHGYTSFNHTEVHYAHDSGLKDILSDCISFKDEDISFEFLVLNNSQNAIGIYKQYYEAITEELALDSPLREEISLTNYCIYTLDNGVYYRVAIRVENTVIYAYSTPDKKDILNSILNEINYLKPEVEIETSA